MPRTTIDLDPTVLEELRQRAVEERKSMGQVASELLAAGLDTGSERGEPAPLGWARKRMGPFKLDLEDKQALSRLLDAEDLGAGQR